MFRYFFHIRSGLDLRTDVEGVILPDQLAAVAWAIKTARRLISDEALVGSWPTNKWVEVEDHQGNRLHTLAFTDALIFPSSASFRPPGTPNVPELQDATNAAFNSKPKRITLRKGRQRQLAKGGQESQVMRSFRFRTAVLVGVWRSRSDDAEADAVRSGQAVGHTTNSMEIRWLVKGAIEASPELFARDDTAKDSSLLRVGTSV